MREKKSIIELTHATEEEYRLKPKRQLSLLADNVRSLHNVGSFFRTADALLVREIVLGGITGIPPHPEIDKTALGAQRSVSWRHVDDSFKEVEKMKALGVRILVLEQAHDSVDLATFVPDPEEEYLLVVGNEVEGVDQRIVDIADAILEIPQWGVKHSLNVSVSAGIALWHLASSGLEPRHGVESACPVE